MPSGAMIGQARQSERLERDRKRTHEQAKQISSTYSWSVRCFSLQHAARACLQLQQRRPPIATRSHASGRRCDAGGVEAAAGALDEGAAGRGEGLEVRVARARALRRHPVDAVGEGRAARLRQHHQSAALSHRRRRVEGERLTALRSLAMVWRAFAHVMPL